MMTIIQKEREREVDSLWHPSCSSSSSLLACFPLSLCHTSLFLVICSSIGIKRRRKRKIPAAAKLSIFATLFHESTRDSLTIFLCTYFWRPGYRGRRGRREREGKDGDNKLRILLLPPLFLPVSLRLFLLPCCPVRLEEKSIPASWSFCS